MSRNRIHATEQQLGYYRKYATRHGDVLRMIRMQAQQPEPVEDEPEQEHFLEALAVAALIAVAFWVTYALLAATQPPVMPA